MNTVVGHGWHVTAGVGGEGLKVYGGDSLPRH